MKLNKLVRRAASRLVGTGAETAEALSPRERLARENPDFGPEHLDTILAVQPYTMTSAARLFAVIEAVKYVSRRGIEGDIVECGVWRGGSMMAAARTLLSVGDTSRHLHLFDTYEGMPPPTDHDVAVDGTTASDALDGADREDSTSYWCYAPLEGVQEAMYTVGYPRERIHFVKGKVEDTIPAHAPGRIAILRLDTDWYESTRHELENLYPRLAPGGVLIIDDYGHWEGSRKATDEFIGRTPGFGLLSRIDYTGRLAIKG